MTEPMDVEPATDGTQELSSTEIRGWVEFGCWTILALAPVLYWVNGPAVSPDQFVVRSALIAIAASGALGLRTLALVRRRK